MKHADQNIRHSKPDRDARTSRFAVCAKGDIVNCEINLIKGTKKVNGKSIMGVMTLGLAKGDEITLEVSGEQEQAAMEELGKISKWCTNRKRTWDSPDGEGSSDRQKTPSSASAKREF